MPVLMALTAIIHTFHTFDSYTYFSGFYYHMYRDPNETYGHFVNRYFRFSVFQLKPLQKKNSYNS